MFLFLSIVSLICTFALAWFVFMALAMSDNTSVSATPLYTVLIIGFSITIIFFALWWFGGSIHIGWHR